MESIFELLVLILEILILILIFHFYNGLVVLDW